MKKSIIGILILALIFIIPSCEMNPENPVGKGGIHISIKDMKYADEYILTYMGPESNAVNVVDSHSIYLANIKEGKYSYELQAKYKGILIGNSSGEFTIRPNENVDLSINVDLTKGLVPVVAIGANGDYDRVELTLYDGNTMKQLSVVTESNTVMVLNPGLYVLGVKAYKNEVCMAAAQSQPIVVNAIEADPVILSLSQFSADVVFSCGIEGGNNYKLFIKPVENSEYTVIESLSKDISITQLAAGMYKYKMMVFCDSEVIAQSEERSLSIESNNKLLVDVPMTREKTLLSISVSNVPVDRFREEILVYSSNGQEIVTKSNNNAAHFWLKPGDYKVIYAAYDSNDLKLGESLLVNTSVVYEGNNTENLRYEPINASQEIEITNIPEADRYIVNYHGLQQGSLEFNGVKTGCISTLPAGVYSYDAYAYSGDIVIGRILNQSFTVDSFNNGKIYITLEQTKYKTEIYIDNTPVDDCIHDLRIYDENGFEIDSFDIPSCSVWLESGAYRVTYRCIKDNLQIGGVDYSTIYVKDYGINKFGFEYKQFLGAVIFTEKTITDSTKIIVSYEGPVIGEDIISKDSNGRFVMSKKLPVGNYKFTVSEFYEDIQIASLVGDNSFLIRGETDTYLEINAVRSKNVLNYSVSYIPQNIDQHIVAIYKTDGSLVKSIDNNISSFEYLDIGEYKLVYDGYSKGIHKGHSESDVVIVSSDRQGYGRLQYTQVKGSLAFDFNALPYVDTVEITCTVNNYPRTFTLTSQRNEIRDLTLGNLYYNVKAYYKGILIGNSTNEMISIETDKVHYVDQSFVLSSRALVELTIVNKIPEYQDVVLIGKDNIPCIPSRVDDNVYTFIIPSGDHGQMRVQIKSDSKLVNESVLLSPFSIEQRTLKTFEYTVSANILNYSIEGSPYPLGESTISIFQENGTLVSSISNSASGYKYLDIGSYYLVFDWYNSGVHKGHVKSNVFEVSNVLPANIKLQYEEVKGALAFDFKSLAYVDKLVVTSETFGSVTLTPENNIIKDLPLGVCTYSATAYYKDVEVGNFENANVAIETDIVYYICKDLIHQEKGIIELSILNDIEDYAIAKFVVNGIPICNSVIKENSKFVFILPNGEYVAPSIQLYSSDEKLLNEVVLNDRFNIKSGEIITCAVSTMKECVDVRVNLNNMITNTFIDNSVIADAKYSVTLTNSLGTKFIGYVRSGEENVVFNNVLEGPVSIEIGCTWLYGNTVTNSDVLMQTIYDYDISKGDSVVNIDLAYKEPTIKILLPDFKYMDKLSYYYINFAIYENYMEVGNITMNVGKSNAKNYLLFPDYVFDDLRAMSSSPSRVRFYLAYYSGIGIDYAMATINIQDIDLGLNEIDFRNVMVREEAPRLWIRVGQNLANQYEMTSCQVDSLQKKTFVSTNTCIYDMPTMIPGEPLAEHLVHIWGKIKGSQDEECELGTFKVSVNADYPGQGFEIILESLSGNQFEVNLLTKN